MVERGLYSLIIKTFEGESPLDPDSEAGTTRLADINASLRRQIAAGYLEDIASLLKSDRRAYMDPATWHCLSDHLTGKLIRKRGAKEKSTYFRDELITLKIMELVLEGHPVAEAFFMVHTIDGCGIGIKAIEAIYYANRRGYEGSPVDRPLLTVEEVRKWGLDAQLQENERRKRRGESKISFFPTD